MAGSCWGDRLTIWILIPLHIRRFSSSKSRKFLALTKTVLHRIQTCTFESAQWSWLCRLPLVNYVLEHQHNLLLSAERHFPFWAIWLGERCILHIRRIVFELGQIFIPWFLMNLQDHCVVHLDTVKLKSHH